LGGIKLDLGTSINVEYFSSDISTFVFLKNVGYFFAYYDKVLVFLNSLFEGTLTKIVTLVDDIFVLNAGTDS
jgi:hypothetical protein